MIILGSIFRICQPDGLTNAKLSKKTAHGVVRVTLFFPRHNLHAHRANAILGPRCDGLYCRCRGVRLFIISQVVAVLISCGIYCKIFEGDAGARAASSRKATSGAFFLHSQSPAPSRKRSDHSSQNVYQTITVTCHECRRMCSPVARSISVKTSFDRKAYYEPSRTGCDVSGLVQPKGETSAPAMLWLPHRARHPGRGVAIGQMRIIL